MPVPSSNIIIHTSGRWRPGEVVCRWTASSRRIVPEVEREIQLAWSAARDRPGIKLFNGPMCRLEAWAAGGGRLALDLSRTSYRIFLGTNMRGGDASRRWGREVLANPLGVSCALEAADGVLLLGRRNERVAYYPSRVHPFAGSLEPGESPDVFAEMGRELAEELGLTDADITEMTCLGLIEDRTLRQPELVLHARVNKASDQLRRGLDEQEHRGCITVPPDPPAVQRLLRDEALTPVAAGTVRLWARERFDAPLSPVTLPP